VSLNLLGLHKEKISPYPDQINGVTKLMVNDRYK